MTSLKTLVLRSNYLLNGQIPSQIGNLESLQLLSLARSSFSGSLPTEIGQLSNLLGLLNEDNPVEGQVPSELGVLEDLVWLDLSSSQSLR